MSPRWTVLQCGGYYRCLFGSRRGRGAIGVGVVGEWHCGWTKVSRVDCSAVAVTAVVCVAVCGSSVAAVVIPIYRRCCLLPWLLLLQSVEQLCDLCHNKCLAVVIIWVVDLDHSVSL